MTLILGGLMTAAGLVYLVMTLKEGVARDKAGVPLARRRGQPWAYFGMVGLFAAMIVIGGALVLMAIGVI